MKRRAYTLVEVLTYLVCCVVIGALVASIFRFVWRTERTSEATFEVTGMAHTTLQTMRAELEETALATVRTHRTSQSLSFCSSRDDRGQLTVSEYGTPRWQRSVLYRAQGGQLLRWEKPNPSAAGGRNPFPLELPVTMAVTQAKVCLRDVSPDGFRVQFVQREGGEKPDRLVDTNPLFNQDAPASNTRLIQVEFRIADGAPQRQNFYAIRWRVSPRY